MLARCLNVMDVQCKGLALRSLRVSRLGEATAERWLSLASVVSWRSCQIVCFQKPGLGYHSGSNVGLSLC